MRGRPPGTSESVFCRHCGHPIVHCRGRQVDWMHEATRREACPAGGFAEPETEREVARVNFGRRSRRVIRESVGS